MSQPSLDRLDTKLWKFLALRWMAMPSALIAALPAAVSAAIVLPGLNHKSLFYDEAWVANNILHGTLNPSVLGPTPIGFAATVALVARSFGPTEFSFRLTAAVFGVASVLLLFFLAREIGNSRLTGFMASVLLATNLPLLIYAQTLKPYTADVFCSVVLVFMLHRLIERQTARLWLIYGAMVMISALLSFASAFTTAIGGIVLFSSARHDRKRLRLCILTHGVLVILLGAYLLLIVRVQAAQNNLYSFWADGFADSSNPVRLIKWYVTQLRDLGNFFLVPAGSRTGYFGVWGLCVGLYVVLKSRRWYQSMLLVGPFIAAAVSASLSLYPFCVGKAGGGRLLLFALPGIVVLAATGVTTVVRLTYGAYLGGIGVLLIVATLAPGIRSAERVFSNPYIELPGHYLEETRALLTQEMRPGLRDGDLIYVYFKVASPFEVYMRAFRRGPPVGWGERRTVTEEGVKVVFGGGGSPEECAAELLSVVGKGEPNRLWLVLGHADYEGEQEPLIQALSTYGNIELDRKDRGARVLRSRARPEG